MKIRNQSGNSPIYVSIYICKYGCIGMDGWMHAWMDALSHGWMDAFSKKNDKQNHGFLNFMAVYFDLLHVFFHKIRFEGMKTKFG